MSNESPFFLSKVECPICKTINEFETVRAGAYFENGRDTDFCPMEIKWRHTRYQGYNPLTFFTATCSNCHYSREFTSTFKDWKNDTNFRTYRLKTAKEQHLDQLARADSVIKSLGEAVDVSRHPNESAIVKLHLTIFDELVYDHPSNLDLGRFYLRIGWVFREMEKGENPSAQFLKGLMLEVDNRYSTFKEAIGQGRQELQTLARHISSHFESAEIATDLKSQMLPFKERFQAQKDALETVFQQIEERADGYAGLINEYKSVTLGGDGNGGNGAFGAYSSFTEFLLTQKKQWEGIVVNEQEALEKAIVYYKKAYTSGHDISPGNQQIQASYLIAELSRRIGDHDGAREYFNTTIKHGQEFIYANRNDRSRTALTRKILELAIEQGKANMAVLKSG